MGRLKFKIDTNKQINRTVRDGRKSFEIPSFLFGSKGPRLMSRKKTVVKERYLKIRR